MSGMEGWSGMDGLVTKTRSIPWRGVLALIGGFLIQVVQKKLSIPGQKKSESAQLHICPQLSLGSFYSFGNMMTYLTSYMRWQSFT